MAEEKKEQVESTEPKGKKNLILLIAVVINTVVMGTVGFLHFSFMKKEAAKPSIEDLVKGQLDAHGSSKDAKDELAEHADSHGKEVTGEVVDELLLPLDGFTVNLAQGDGPRRYLRLETVLKFDKSSKKEEYEAKKPQIRDAIISILNSKRPEDLMKKEGKAYLKEEIKSAINSFMIDGKVADVFYVGFQIN